jgi:hypothetical protein
MKLSRQAMGVTAVLCGLIALGGMFAERAEARTFTSRQVTGNYACNLTTEGNLITELIQFSANGKGAVSSGEMSFNYEGEVCHMTLTPSGSTYSVNADGSGVAALNWSVNPSSDPDGDLDCDTFLFGTSTPSFTESYDFILDTNGTHLRMSGHDDEFTFPGNTADIDFLPTYGDCNKQ